MMGKFRPFQILVVMLALASCMPVPVTGDIRSVQAGTALTWVVNALDPMKPGGEILMAVRDRIYIVISVPWQGGRGVVGAIDMGIKSPGSLLHVRGNFMDMRTYLEMKSGLLGMGWQEVKRGSTPVLLSIAAEAASQAVRTLPTPVIMLSPTLLPDVITFSDGSMFRLNMYQDGTQE
jgi:hypothetical protein